MHTVSIQYGWVQRCSIRSHTRQACKWSWALDVDSGVGSRVEWVGFGIRAASFCENGVGHATTAILGGSWDLVKKLLSTLVELELEVSITVTFFPTQATKSHDFLSNGRSPPRPELKPRTRSLCQTQQMQLRIDPNSDQDTLYVDVHIAAAFVQNMYPTRRSYVM